MVLFGLIKDKACSNDLIKSTIGDIRSALEVVMNVDLRQLGL